MSFKIGLILSNVKIELESRDFVSIASLKTDNYLKSEVLVIYIKLVSYFCSYD